MINCAMVLYYQIAGNVATFKADVKKKRDRYISDNDKDYFMPRPEDLAYYKKLRVCQIELNRKLSNTIKKEELEKNGEALGIRRNGVLVFASEEIVNIFADHNIYKIDSSGRNAVHKWIEQHPPKENSDEKLVLEAMSIARYSIFTVDGLVPGYGVSTRDILQGDGGFIMDVGFSRSGIKGMLFAGRILAVDSAFSMTTGAMLPFDRKSLDTLENILVSSFKNYNHKRFTASAEEEQVFETAVIKMLLSTGVADRFITEDVTGSIKRSSFRPIRSSQPKTGPSRNAPCPCGSGKKYKKCCGK